ncbi:hypothetical protein [Streptomyces sp. NBC_01443]|uniref:hypothetical protein n=1 Tax=Streptomyces sp. NBC_01443 TaxID=2903868 RepID=UPI002251662E|nr:hypothetical protein [Streptomyces sp. NBC_01443]MCX4632046.1 hypothetical protein [Streptomyces sp. NBC_01443]
MDASCRPTLDEGLVVEQPPRGEGESGPRQTRGAGEADAECLADLFDPAGDAAVVQVGGAQ